MRSFWNQVQRMSLDIQTIAPVHGKPVPWSAFVKAMGASAANMCAGVGSGGSTVMVPCPTN
jgi:hypothetical protein